jgi:hypothetical protein
VVAIELIAVQKPESSNSDPKVQKVTQQSQNAPGGQNLTNWCGRFKRPLLFCHSYQNDSTPGVKKPLSK